MRLLWEISTSSKTQLRINLKKSTLKYELETPIPSIFVLSIDDQFVLEEYLEPNSSIFMKFTETTDDDNNLTFTGEGTVKTYNCSMNINCGKISKMIGPTSKFSVYIPVRHLKYEMNGDTYKYTYSDKSVWKPEGEIAAETKRYQDDRKTVNVKEPVEQKSFSVEPGYNSYPTSTPMARPPSNNYHKAYSDRIHQKIRVELPSPNSTIQNRSDLGASYMPDNKTNREPEDREFLEVIQRCQDLSVHKDIVQDLINWSYHNRQMRGTTHHLLTEEDILTKADQIKKKSVENESPYENLQLNRNVKLDKREEETLDQQFMTPKDIEEQELRKTLNKVIIFTQNIL